MAKVNKISESANDSMQLSAHEGETFRFKNIPNTTLKIKKKKNGDYIFIFNHEGETDVYNIYEMLAVFSLVFDDLGDFVKFAVILDKYSQGSRLYIQLKTDVIRSKIAREDKRSICESKMLQKTYLIKDKRTGATKIGKSNNPYKREKTLQSEALSLELLYICNDNVESLLHKKYKHKRIRGEWFNLTDNDINEIISKYKFVRAY